MQKIQNQILELLWEIFPGSDLMPQYDNGLHIIVCIIQMPTTTFSIKLPPGFLATEMHLKNGKTVVINMMIHEQMFIETYRQTIEIPLKCYA